MKFTRGKSFDDPIYLRCPKGEYWMAGDVYDEVCKCLDQIFGGRRRYQVNGYTPDVVDFRNGNSFSKITVTDFDGEVHGFVARVVDRDKFDESQRGGRFREVDSQGSPDRSPSVEENCAKPELGVEEEVDEKVDEKIEEDVGEDIGSDSVINGNPASTEDDDQDVIRELRMEMDMARMKSEMEKDGILTPTPKSGKIAAKPKRNRKQK